MTQARTGGAQSSLLSGRRTLLILAFIVGLSLRLFEAMLIGLDAPPVDDAQQYDTYAWNLANGFGYRGMSPDVTDQNHLTAHRAPGTSVLWAALYMVFGHRVSAVRIAHCFLGAVTIFLVYAIANTCFGNRIDMLSAWAFALWPTSLLYSTELASEPLFAFLLLAYVLVSLRVAINSRMPQAIGAGVLLGAATLTRGNAVFMIPLTALWACWIFRDRWRSLGVGLAIPVAASLTLVPWAIRNYFVFHEVLPLGTAGGDPFLGGNNRVVASDVRYYGYWVPPASLPEYGTRLKQVNSELRRYHLENQLGVQWLREHPERWAYLLQAKIRRFLTPFLASDTAFLYRIGMLLSWGPVLILSLLSLMQSGVSFARTRHPGLLLHLTLLGSILTAVAFWGGSRFRYPVEALFIVFACASARELWDGIMARRHRIRGI